MRHDTVRASGDLGSGLRRRYRHPKVCGVCENVCDVSDVCEARWCDTITVTFRVILGDPCCGSGGTLDDVTDHLPAVSVRDFLPLLVTSRRLS